MYRNERAAVLRGIDEKLYSGATGIGELFPDSYHAGITAKAVISDAEYLSYVNRLTDLARKNGFQWLYTYMEVDGRIVIFFFNDTATTDIYTLSLHDALPISSVHCAN